MITRSSFSSQDEYYISQMPPDIYDDTVRREAQKKQLFRWHAFSNIYTHVCIHGIAIDAGLTSAQKASWIAETSCIPFGRIVGPKARFVREAHTDPLVSNRLLLDVFPRESINTRDCGCNEPLPRPRTPLWSNDSAFALPSSSNASTTDEINSGADRGEIIYYVHLIRAFAFSPPPSAFLCQT